MRAFLLAAVAAVGLWPARGAAGTRVVVMPVSNLSGHGGAAPEASRQVALRLAMAGYDVISGEPVDRILARDRVRYVESLQPEMVEKLLRDLDAKAVVFPTVLEYGSRSASAAMSARMIGPGGRTLASATAGLTSDDTTGPLGFGRVKSSLELLERVAARVVASLPRAAQEKERDPRVPARVRARKVWTYRSRALEAGRPQRVCVLPIQNATTEGLGPRIISDLLTVRMRGLGDVQAIPPAELRGALLAEGIHSLYDLGPDRMKALGKRLGTPLFLRGILRVYKAAPATIELELSLVDAEKNRIVWTSYRRAEGGEYRHLLELGAITSPAVLADQVIAEMLEALSRA